MGFQKHISRVFSNLIFWHILFWILSFSLFTLSFITTHSNTGEWEWTILLIGLIYNIHFMMVVYVNYLFLIPRYASKRKVFKYFMYVVLFAMGVAVLYSLTMYLVLGESPAFSTFIGFFILEFIYIIITSFFKFFKDWLTNIGLKMELLEIEKQKVEAELDTLKSQLNPHFLFNVLNNIYSHSLLKSEVTPSIVIKLSDLMSYILYDCKTKTVPLQKEIEFINNYIELEKIRMEKNIEITMDIDKEKQIRVPPLLFFPLIENAFKHGMGSYPKKREIRLKFEMHDKRLIFQIQNTRGNLKNGITRNAKGGIGIENVKKRLALLYPGQYRMKVMDEDESFAVWVEIENVEKVN